MKLRTILKFTLQIEWTFEPFSGGFEITSFEFQTSLKVPPSRHKEPSTPNYPRHKKYRRRFNFNSTERSRMEFHLISENHTSFITILKLARIFIIVRIIHYQRHTINIMIYIGSVYQVLKSLSAFLILLVRLKESEKFKY